MKRIDITCNYETKTAKIGIYHIDKKTGAYSPHRYKLKRGDASEARLMQVINKYATRTEYHNNQYNNYGEIVTVYL